MTFTWSAATIALLLPLAAACSRRRPSIGSPWTSIGPARSSPRSRPPAIATSRRCRTTCAKDAPPHARPNTSAIASWRGRASPTTRATTPWRSRRPRASRRCSPTIRRRCCSAGTCSTRCTASARRRRSRDAWSPSREFVLDYGLLGDALMEQGRLAEAAEAYQKMIDLKPFYQSYTRAAHLRWLRGDLDGAIDMMRAAVKAASPRDPESIAWAYARLAVYELQRGRLAAAGQMADASLRSVPDYAAALLARGRIELARKKPVDAVETLTRAARLNPLPEYQWALADALRLLGRDRRGRRPRAAAGAGRQPRRSAHARALPLHATAGRRQGSGPRAT